MKSCVSKNVFINIKLLLFSDLRSRSLLDRQTEVTCASPPSLRGRPVWNVSVCVTSPPPKPPSVTQTAHRKPTSETCATSRPSSDTNVVFTLVVVIVVLSLLLFVGFFLAVLHRRKHNSKAMTPGRPEENRPELKEGGRSSRAPSPGNSEKREINQWDSETGWRTSFTGVRAKSANAVLFMSPFCAPVKDEVTLQTEMEAQSEDAGKQKLGDETEVDGGVETDDADVIRNGKQAEAGGDLDEKSHRVSVNTTNTVPYLSIATNQNKLSPDDFNKRSTDGSAQRSQTGKVMGRISTWPPTAVQWQARCKAKEDEEQGTDVFAVWTPMFPAEVKTEERPSGSDWDKKEDDIENNPMEGLRTAPNQDPLKMTAAPVSLGHSRSSKPNDDTTCFSEALTHTGTRLEAQLKKEMILDPTTVGRTQTLNEGKLCPDQDLKSAANRAQKKSSTKAEQRNELQRAVTSRQRAENGPKAPSGGASPDDETLLSGNEYAFMDLLHEVVQNNGRWTRDRWKQKEANKQRRHDRAAERSLEKDSLKV
ncbi:uncharacterized protein LOC116384542 isoform X2 [Anarrhichthys ocellatus]|uniref:uncharacterized protein LOC116384542 isoform X2 n=1 Tax=Anarrhichthys ocellatus TaxID=433405 RepID=UPI0012EE4AF6|nr:uncharacterized protein LOC116384542 isoform X2 [Anarrhichthys ocellatus]